MRLLKISLGFLLLAAADVGANRSAPACGGPATDFPPDLLSIWEGLRPPINGCSIVGLFPGDSPLNTELLRRNRAFIFGSRLQNWVKGYSTLKASAKSMVDGGLPASCEFGAMFPRVIAKPGCAEKFRAVMQDMGAVESDARQGREQLGDRSSGWEGYFELARKTLGAVPPTFPWLERTYFRRDGNIAVHCMDEEASQLTLISAPDQEHGTSDAQKDMGIRSLVTASLEALQTMERLRQIGEPSRTGVASMTSLNLRKALGPISQAAEDASRLAALSCRDMIASYPARGVPSVMPANFRGPVPNWRRLMRLSAKGGEFLRRLRYQVEGNGPECEAMRKMLRGYARQLNSYVNTIADTQMPLTSKMRQLAAFGGSLDAIVDEASIGTPPGFEARCEEMEKSLEVVACTDYTSVATSQRLALRAYEDLGFPACPGEDNSEMGLVPLPPLPERDIPTEPGYSDGYNLLTGLRHRGRVRVSEQLCEGYNRWLASGPCAGRRGLAEITSCVESKDSSMEQYCLAGGRADPVCMYPPELRARTEYRPTGAGSPESWSGGWMIGGVGGGGSRQPEEPLRKATRPEFMENLQGLLGEESAPVSEGHGRVGGPRTEVAAQPYIPTFQIPIETTTVPVTPAVVEPESPMAAATSRRAATESAELADLRRLLELEREVNALTERRLSAQAPRREEAPGELAVSPADAEAAKPSDAEVGRSQSAGARAAVVGSAPVRAPAADVGSLQPTVINNPPAVPAEVAAIAPAAGISVSAVAGNLGAIQAQVTAMGATGRVSGLMLIAGVEVGTSPDTAPVGLPAPPAELATVAEYMDYIRGHISSEMLQHRGPVIVQLGDGGSMWKVQLREGQIVVEPVGAEQITQVRQFYATALQQAISGLRRTE